jgi:hypothetical protein
MFELHTIYQLRMLDITMMSIMCTLVYTCDEQKRLEFLNPTQINQLELNPIINKKSETFKGMSKKKRAAAIKKAQKALTKEKRDLASTHIGQIFQRFKDRQCIMAPYNFE